MTLRSAVNEGGDVERPTWSSLFLPAAFTSSNHPTPMKKETIEESE